MAFDPDYPPGGAPMDPAVMRTQLNALRQLIDAVLTDAVIDSVATNSPGMAATASLSLVDGVLHLSLGIPAGETGAAGPTGSSGSDGATGAQGQPGEVSNVDLASAIAGTARNPTGLATLATPYADPASEELRQFCNTLLNLLFRPPT